MAKYPRLGKVKTRIAKDIGDEMALSIYHQLLEKTLKVSSDFNGNKFLCLDQFPNPLPYLNEHDFEIKFQGEGNLGERMYNAFLQVHKEGDRTIVIGADCWTLTSEILNTANKALDKIDFVLGPAKDGGYYLLGLNQLHSQIFDLKEWSHSKVLEETLFQIKALEKSFLLLEELSDIDTYADWQNRPNL